MSFPTNNLVCLSVNLDETKGTIDTAQTEPTPKLKITILHLTPEKARLIQRLLNKYQPTEFILDANIIDEDAMQFIAFDKTAIAHLKIHCYSNSKWIKQLNVDNSNIATLDLDSCSLGTNIANLNLNGSNITILKLVNNRIGNNLAVLNIPNTVTDIALDSNNFENIDTLKSFLQTNHWLKSIKLRCNGLTKDHVTELFKIIPKTNIHTIQFDGYVTLTDEQKEILSENATKKLMRQFCEALYIVNQANGNRLYSDVRIDIFEAAGASAKDTGFMQRHYHRHANLNQFHQSIPCDGKVLKTRRATN